MDGLRGPGVWSSHADSTLPALGTVGVVAAFLSLLPLVVWEALVARRLLELARTSDDTVVHRRRQRQSAVSE